MELSNEFEVSVPPERAWTVLTDLERIAPCLPGAELQEVEGDEYRGVVKVKVGPISAQYKGKAEIVQADESAREVTVEAAGRDTRGQGTASATIRATLRPAGEGTHVDVLTDLAITGKVAQFGRGVLADVSTKLMGQFVENLETSVLSGDGDEAPSSDGTTPESAEDEGSGVRKIEGPPAEHVDLVGAAGTPVLKRLLPALGAAIALIAFGYLLRRRRRPTPSA